MTDYGNYNQQGFKCGDKVICLTSSSTYDIGDKYTLVSNMHGLLSNGRNTWSDDRGFGYPSKWVLLPNKGDHQ